MRRVLVVEDEDSIRELIALNLRMADYEVLETESAEKALALLGSEGRCDAAVLDVMLPGMNGFSLCEAIRRDDANIGIIILSAKSMEQDKIRGLSIGADDYMTKPFNILELKARVKALLKRAAGSGRQEKSEEITVGALTLDQREHVVRRGETRVELTAKEYDLLELLMKHPRRVYSREVLMNVVWGYEYQGDFRTVDVHVRRLREKIEENPAQPEYILTKWGVGYYFKG